MLNRTNRTLSANLNRLNLGTRSLAVNASANNGSLTLRTALVYHFVDVRAVVAEHPDSDGSEASFIMSRMMMGLKPSKPAMSPRHGSSPELPQIDPSCQLRDQQGQQTILLAIPAALPALDLAVDGRTRRGDATRTATPARRPARTPVLGWRLARSRRAGRAAHAVQVSDAAS